MISSIFLFTFDCLNCITGWPWLYLGLNQQTNSYFIDNLRDDPGDTGQTVMFMIQATDIHLFTVLMIGPPYSNTQHNILTVSIWHFGHVLSSSEFKFLQIEDKHVYQSIKIPTNVLMSFADKVDQGYRKFRNPYHNPNHAADVAQTTHFYICKTGMKSTGIHWKLFIRFRWLSSRGRRPGQELFVGDQSGPYPTVKIRNHNLKYE